MFRLYGAQGGYAGCGAEHTALTPVAAKRTSADGGGTGVSSVGEEGGRPGPHPKPNKGRGWSGAWGGGTGETEGGAGGRQFGWDPSPPWAYKKGS